MQVLVERLREIRKMEEAVAASTAVLAKCGSDEELLVRWSMGDQLIVPKGAPAVIRAVSFAKEQNMSLGLPWEQSVAHAIVRRLLTKYVVQPGEVVAAVAPSAEKELSALKHRIETARELYAMDVRNAKKVVRARIANDAEGRCWSYANQPPVRRGLCETNNIAAGCGWRSAPTNTLLAIAEGLATGNHWWLYNPSDSRSVPAPTSMSQVKQAWEVAKDDQGQWAPNVTIRRLSEDEWELKWLPLMGGDHSDSYARFIVIRIGERQTHGEILWQTGKFVGFLGETWESSTFIGAALSLLPEAENDGTIERMVSEQDAHHARWMATWRVVKSAGVTSSVVDPATGKELIESSSLQRDEDSLLRPGYQPRRLWDATDREIRIARWISASSFRRMVDEAEPLVWKSLEVSDDKGNNAD